MTPIKPANTSQKLFEPVTPSFIESVADLFTGKENSNLQDYLYSLPKFTGDTVNGAALLNEIYEQCPNYYLQREENILIQSAAQSVAISLGSNPAFIDYGPGPIQPVINKTLPILSRLIAPQAYMPIDICDEYLIQLLQHISMKFPGLPINPICDTYYNPELNFTGFNNPVVYFSGSSLFNCPGATKAAIDNQLLSRLTIIKNQLGENGQFLISHDTCQDESRLMQAYSNPANSKFILNMLQLIKRDVFPVGFNPALFQFYTTWNENQFVLESGVQSTQAQEFMFGAKKIMIPQGRKYGITNSVKYPAQELIAICQRAGFNHSQTWSINGNPMMLHLFAVKND